MAHTYSHLLYHVVFSTKDRATYVDEALRPRLHAYLGGIARQIGAASVLVGGTADHVHLLLSLPPATAVADALRVLKANSSRWVHGQGRERSSFAWQTGYAAFSVSRSATDAIKQYIASQEEHHRRMTFQEEFLALLRKHGIQYDERYLWE